MYLIPNVILLLIGLSFGLWNRFDNSTWSSFGSGIACVASFNIFIALNYGGVL
jgi:hypothetical protein